MTRIVDRHELRCYKIGCNGTFTVDETETDVLFECPRCGETLSESGIQKLADDDRKDTVSALAEVLLGSDSHE